MNRRGLASIIGILIGLTILAILAWVLFHPRTGAFWRFWHESTNTTDIRLEDYHIRFGRDVPEAVRGRFAQLVAALDTEDTDCHAAWHLPEARGLDGFGIRLSNIKGGLALHLIDPYGRSAATYHFPQAPCAIGITDAKRTLFKDCLAENPRRTSDFCRDLTLDTISDPVDQFALLPEDEHPDRFKAHYQDEDFAWESRALGAEGSRERFYYFYTLGGAICPVLEVGEGDLEDLAAGTPACGVPCTPASTCEDFTPKGQGICEGRPCNLHCTWKDTRCRPPGAAYSERCASVTRCEDYMPEECRADPCRFVDRRDEGLTACYPLYGSAPGDPATQIYINCYSCKRDITCAHFRRPEDCGPPRFCGQACTWTAGKCEPVSDLP